MKKALLLGAGFSYDLGMPLTNELTEILLGIFEKKSALNFAKNISKHSPYGKERPINEQAIFEGINLICEYAGNNYEYLIAHLDNLRGKDQSDRDSYHYLSGYLYRIVYNILKHYQLESYSIIYPKNFTFYSKLTDLLTENSETWAFSLNHDIYLECLALDLGIPISYGDNNSNLKYLTTNSGKKLGFTEQARDRITAKENFITNKTGINLVKLHGGLNEFIYSDNEILLNQSLAKGNSFELMNEFRLTQDLEYKSNVRGIGKDIFIPDQTQIIDILGRSMLTGGNKYSRTNKKKRGEEKLQLLDYILRNVDELTVIGYGFNDYHINFRISNAMLLNEKLKIRIVDPTYGNKKLIEMLHQFDYDSRIRGAICSASDWVGYTKTQKWHTPDERKIRDKNNKDFRIEFGKKPRNYLI